MTQQTDTASGTPRPAWQVEDDDQHGVEDPSTWTEVGEAILALYGAEAVTDLIHHAHLTESDIAWSEWDFSDAGQLGDWLLEGGNLETCAWHMPTDVYESDDEDAWRQADAEGRIIKRQPWSAVAPAGYTRIVWVTL